MTKFLCRVRHEHKDLVGGVQIEIIGRVGDHIAGYRGSPILGQVQVSEKLNYFNFCEMNFFCGSYLYRPMQSMPWFLNAVTNRSSYLPSPNFSRGEPAVKRLIL